MPPVDPAPAPPAEPVGGPTCTCWDKAPTVPDFRSRTQHLPDCPAYNGAAPPAEPPRVPDDELQRAWAFVEELAEERHMLHGAEADRFWTCSRPPCQKASEFLRGLKKWFCQARAVGTGGGNDPAECDWPFCGCDPVAGRVLAAIQESGLEIVKQGEVARLRSAVAEIDWLKADLQAAYARIATQSDILTKRAEKPK